MSVFLHRAGLVFPQLVYTPASYVFNGTDEALARTLSTSGASTTIFTYSLWVRVAAYDEDQAVVFQSISGDESQFLFAGIDISIDGLRIGALGTSVDWAEEATGVTPDIGNAWRHIVFRYDSTQATADDRARMYVDGTLITDSTPEAIGLNEGNLLFSNGFEHQIGAWLDVAAYFDGKIAFIDVLEGVSAAPTAFAFDDGGTWTRMPYAGSYGTYGFSLDGSDTFNDVSGNGQNFTGVNMDGSNLDAGDLPPYTT